MTVGFILLSHERPGHTARLARHLSAQGAPVVIHMDRRANCRAELSRAVDGAALVMSTQISEWGTFGLTAATLDAARLMLAQNPEVTHICLISASCLPLRPVSELNAFLRANPGTDFIESAPAEGWVKGGLDIERFTLRHPFAWKRRRRLFDANVEIQRKLKLARRMPAGLTPYLGLQWWCLTTASMKSILGDPALPGWTSFFRHVWIPDEAFFQTLVRRAGHPARIDPRPLTLSRFDANGQPFTFHDDHIRLLSASDYFFARKADPDAEGLIDWALGHPGKGHARFLATVNEEIFHQAETASRAEHRGTQNAARFPKGQAVMFPETARPYSVFVADDLGLLRRLREAMRHAFQGLVFHGRLFGQDRAEFSEPGETYAGNLSGDPVLRDYRPEQFLSQLIWADRRGHTAFLLAPKDDGRIARRVVQDRNARIICVAAPRKLEALEAELASVASGTAPLARKARFFRVDAPALRRELDEGIDTIQAAIAGFMFGFQPGSGRKPEDPAMKDHAAKDPALKDPDAPMNGPRDAAR